MTYRKSAAPYVLLLIVLIIGVPMINYQVEKKQTIKIEIKQKSAMEQPFPIALNQN